MLVLEHRAAGRSCPADYRVPDELFQGRPQLSCPVLYVAGGVYGNLWALDSLEHLVASEPGAKLVLNGDFHWFDANPEVFVEIENRVAKHHALIGNIEAELRRPLGSDVGAGCGCAYPDSVYQDTVDRSNQIHARLKQLYEQLPQLHQRMASRPMSLLAQVAGHRIAVAHGDESVLAGWSCSRDCLASQNRQAQLRKWMRERNVSVLAVSHTCAPAVLAWNDGAVFNNGAAGMPNFAWPGDGLCTRIAADEHPQARYRAHVGNLVVEGMPVVYDQEAFLACFDSIWPTGSPAACSYRTRITQGTCEQPADALVEACG